jgi:hypothetical protein
MGAKPAGLNNFSGLNAKALFPYGLRAYLIKKKKS